MWLLPGSQLAIALQEPALLEPGRKPLVPLQVNRGNLPEGVEYAIPFQRVIENVGGPYAFDPIPAGVELVDSPYGPGALITGEGYIDLDESLMDAVAADSITIAGLYYYDGSDAGAQFFDGRQGTNDGYEVAVSRNLITFTVDHGGVNSTSIGNSGDTTPGLRWFVARFDGTYIRLVSSHAGEATPVSHPGSAINGNSWRLGNSYNPNTPFGDVGVLLGAIFDSQVWNELQVDAFMRNPWGFAFRPGNDRPLYIAAAGGGGTTIEASLTLGRTDTVAPSVTADLHAAAALGTQAGLAEGAVANLLAESQLSSVAALAAEVITDLQGSLSLSMSAAVTHDGVVSTGPQTIDASVALGRSASVSPDAVADLAAVLALGRTDTVAQDGAIAGAPQTIDAALTLSQARTLQQLGAANLFAAAALGQQLALDVAGGSEVVAALSLALSRGIAQTVEIGIGGQVSLGTTVDLSTEQRADLAASLPLAQQVAVQTVAQAVLGADLSLDCIRTVTVVGSTVEVSIVLGSQTLRVVADGRSLRVF